VLSLIALVVIYPLFFALNSALKTPMEYGQHPTAIVKHPTTANFSFIWEQADVLTGLRNSLLVAVGTIALLWACGAMAGYAVAKLRFKGRAAFFLFVLSGLVVPFQTIVSPLYAELQDLHLLDTYIGMILVFAALGMPVTSFVFAAYFRGLPDSLIEAARLDGASTAAILLRVILPMARPALAITGIVNFFIVFINLLAPLIVMQSPGKQLFVVELAQVFGRFPQPTWQAAGVVIGLAPLLVVFLLAQRFLIRGITAGAVR
jgi:ABC-type glycerol-3-phosphate transport system permease component